MIDARAAGKLPLLIVQGVLMTPLAAAADVVLPGAAWVEKDATYTNDRGMLQGTARVMAPPGDAREDWQLLSNVATALGMHDRATRTPPPCARPSPRAMGSDRHCGDRRR